MVRERERDGGREIKIDRQIKEADGGIFNCVNKSRHVP